MKQIIERQKVCSEKQARFTLQPPQTQCGISKNAALSKEIVEKTLQLRRLNGEELQGLGLEELMKLENLIEDGLSRVTKIKSLSLSKEINTLKKQETQLKEENARLKQKSSSADSSSSSSICISGNTSIHLPDLNS